MYEQHLIQAGLTKNQAIIYETLIKNGSLSASDTARKTKISRPLTYKILDELIEMELVEKDEKKKKVAIFIPAHPMKLKEIVEKRRKHAENARDVVDSIVGKMSSDFNLTLGKPYVQFFEGVDGMKKIYDDILATKKDFYLVRSPFEPVYKKKIEPVVMEFIKKRVKNGNWVIALTPNDLPKESQEALKAGDDKVLMNRTFISTKDYTSPVEIDIYGDKVAFLSFGKELIGNIIESPQIAQAMRELFMLAKKGAKSPMRNSAKESDSS